MGHPYCILEEWQAKEVLQHLYKRYRSVRKLAELLNISKSTLHRCLQGKQSIPTVLRIRLCELLPEEELLQMLKGPQLLRQYGLLDSSNRLNKALVLALIDALMQDEVVKEEVLNYLLKYYKKELMERLGEILPKIELRWTSDFEHWLTEKKSKPISRRTLKDYRNLWLRCLEGRVLGWHLLKQLSGKQMLCYDNQYHPTGWARQVFRHYIRYLYSIGKLDWDTYTRLLLVIPGRRYGRKVSQKVIREEDVVETLRKLDERRRGDILTLYLVILGSGVRLEHTIDMLNKWNPDEELYVDYLSRNVKRLECFQEHCRYYMGKETEVKPVGFVFFPQVLLPLINAFKHSIPNRRNVYRVVKKVEGLPGKYIRIFALREMKRILGDNDTFKFVVGKFGELTVSARHYMDLLEEADKIYPKYIERWLEIVNKAIDLELRSGDIIVLKYKNTADAKQ